MMPSDPRSCRAVVCAGGGQVRLEDRPLRRLERGELLLGLRVSGLCGTDIFKLTNDTAEPGAVLGHEVVGTVLETGGGVTAFSEGDRVVVPHHVACGRCALCARGSETLCPVFRENLLDPGGFAERWIVRERAVRSAARKLPDALRDEAAVFLEPAACVLRGVHRANLPPEGAAGGACAVILGAGSMGLLHCAVLAAVRPDAIVLAVDTVPERLELAERLGARAISAGDRDALAAAVRAATGGLGADAVFDTVGGAEALEGAFAVLREGGTAVLFAHAAASERSHFELNHLFKSERRVVGTYSGSLAEQSAVFDLMAAGKLDPSALVTHRLPLDRFEEGLALCRARRALKVLYVPA